ncbi:MAG: DUF1989 domain-containing protein [Nitrospinota bacterium]
MAKETEIGVPAGEARAFEAKAGQYVTVTNLEGKQVGDFLVFSSADLNEKLGTNHTIVHLGKLIPAVGDQIVSNLRNPMLEVVRDDCGRHDLLIAACDPWRYEIYYQVKGHRNCSDNFLEAMDPWKLKRHELPQPINLFQNMGYADDGSVEFRESLAKPGERIVFRALMDLMGGVSACPMDLNPISGFKVTDLEVRVSDSE